MFSKNTTGYGIGEQIEKDTFTDIPCGCFKGRGTAHFYTQDSITALLGEIGFCDIQTDLLRFTDRGNIVEQILAQAKK